MRRFQPLRSSILLPVVVGLLTLGVAPAWAVTAWDQYQGGPTHSGAVDAGPAPAYREAWSVDVAPGGPRNQYGLSAPILADGLAVAVGPTSVVAVDPATGTEAWTVDRELGPSVPPAVAGSGSDALLLYTEGWGAGPPDASVTPSASTTLTPSPTAAASPVPRTSDQAGSLVAISLRDRSEVWRMPLAVSRTGVSVAGDTAFVGTIAGDVVAVDTATGQTKWKTAVGGFLEAPLAVANDLVLAVVKGNRTTGAQIVALQANDGSEAWRVGPLGGVQLMSAPVVVGDTAYITLDDATVHAIDVQDGSERWTARMNVASLGTTPAVSGDALIAVDARGQVYRFSASTGARVWDFPLNLRALPSVFRTAPVIVGSSVLIATTEGELRTFDLDAGTQTASVAAGGGAPLRYLAVTSDTVVAVRGGSSGGMVGLTNDPGTALTAIVSPTVLSLGTLLLDWLVASVVFVAVMLLLGRFLWARLGPPDFGAGGEADVLVVDGEDE